jgi:hypothetical protein
MRCRHLAAVVCLIACFRPALADGGFSGPHTVTQAGRATSAAQAAVLVREGLDEVLLLRTTYHGPSQSFAWFIPVPSPPREVFKASDKFITQALADTGPITVTHVNTPDPGTFGVPGGGTTRAVGNVRLLGQMVIGDLLASILESNDGSALASWLERNGYAVQEEFIPVFRDYARAGWVFVALRLLDKVASDKPLLEDVPPLGIRFRYSGTRLVFPLRISRVSAPALTAIRLCLIGAEPYRCRGFLTRQVTEPIALPAGKTYGDVRRALTREHGTALLCECSVQERLPCLGLSYYADGGRALRLPNAIRPATTSIFALLKPDEMKDLVFDVDPTRDMRQYRVIIERTTTTDPYRASLFVPGPGTPTVEERLSTRDYAWHRGDKSVGVFEYVEDAVRRFRADTGCLPMDVAALETPADRGWDASGNIVPVENWRGPYITPLSDRRRSDALRRLVFDPLSSLFVDLNLPATVHATALTNGRAVRARGTH